MVVYCKQASIKSSLDTSLRWYDSDGKFNFVDWWSI